MIKHIISAGVFLFLVMFHSSHVSAQARREINLKDWFFTMDSVQLEKEGPSPVDWIKVSVPHTWNDRDIQSGDKVNYGTGWYRMEYISGNIADSQVFIRFEGVGQYAKVFVNGKFVGEHLGSYSAFAFNITAFLKDDTVNTILVRANNELSLSYPKDNFLFGIFGGIYRPASLIITGKVHIGLTDFASSGVYIHPEEVTRDIAFLNVETMVMNDGDGKERITLRNSLLDQEGKVVSSSEVEEVIFPGGLVPVLSKLDIDRPHLWNGRNDPYLYQLKTTILANNRILDEYTQTYGIRYFEVDPEKGFILNGEPYRLFGVCRHQEWQDLGNALSPGHHRKDMELISEMGATSVRLAHYQQSEYIYGLADQLGLLVWAEIPFVNGYLEGADGNAMQQLTELIKQNYNHPSIFVWGVHNEVIKGQVISGPVNLTRKLHNLAKTLDPARYTVAVSNIWWVYDHSIHENTDLQGFNQYTGWYGGTPDGLGNWIKKYHEAKPDVRISISEYGAGANIAHQSADNSSVPDPTGQFFPEGYQTYYHETTWSAIERSPYIWASYVWNMFDFSVPEWDRGGIRGRNHKGLVTYDRTIKKDAFFWYKANWSDSKVLHLTGKRNDTLKGKTATFKAYCNFGTPELYVDGISYGIMEHGINSVQFLSGPISLEKGKHLVEVKAGYNEMIFMDKFIFVIK